MPSPLDLLFPKTSLSGSEGGFITSGELQHLASHPHLYSKMELRDRGIQALDQVFAVSTYRKSPLLKKAVHTFKYRRIPGLGEALQKLFAESVLREFDLRKDAVICPVPLHWTRQFTRGFNQAEVLGGELSKVSGLSLRNLLKRVRPTGHQARRGREERWRALRGAFSTKEVAQVECVYLIDDLLTTGATMEECARVLKESGVQRVEGVVLAGG